MGERAAERFHVDFFAGDALDDVGSGDEDATGGGHDHHVGECGSVGGAAGGESDDHRDLRDVAGGPHHRLEDSADGVQASTPSARRAPPECQMPTTGACSVIAVSMALTMWAHPTTPMAPPITVPSVQ